ncbi:MAG: methionyl aminopeptidase [Acidaminobacteraceae bacterium]
MFDFSRNSKCWCGSGLKYKKCHINVEASIDIYLKNGYKMPDLSLIKTKEDIEGIRKSALITKTILDMLTEKALVGVSTNELNEFVHNYTLSCGGVPAPLNYDGFPSSICTSINEVICHGIPSDRILKDGDIVNIDITTILGGYYSDASRMYMIGNVSEEAKRLVECTKEALEIGLRSVVPYRPFHDIGNAIGPYAKEKGYSIVRDFGGHGVGNDFHEEPFIYHFASDEKDILMLPGMVFTIEPMLNVGMSACKILDDEWAAVTKDGSLSAQWEHTVLVTEDSFEVLV